MIPILSAPAKIAYRFVAKPILFRFPPDNVHANLLAFSKVLQKPAILRHAVHGIFAYQHSSLEQTIHGIHFKNPVGVSAGFDKNIELLPTLQMIGCGLMEGGTITHLPTAGNDRPWFRRLPHTKSIVVHAGLPNRGTDEILPRLMHIAASVRKNFPLNISIAPSVASTINTEKKMIDDCIAGLKKIKKSGVATMITVNLSCPNVKGGEPFSESKNLEKLLTAIDAVELDVPLFIKMPNQLSWDKFSALLDIAASHSVTGITIANLVKDRSKITLHDVLSDATPGGLSGAPTFEPSNECIRQTYLHYGNRFTIIGVGGVFTAEDAYTKIRLGASLVELVTGLIFEGPGIIGDINKGLVALLARDGFTSIEQVIGIDAKKNPTRQQ
jgi:dihydroorotate dehydrogenase (fumarate)